ncbi:hypothetical protein JCM10207_007228 [Rhodosporidiobolus poonsookiae]
MASTAHPAEQSYPPSSTDDIKEKSIEDAASHHTDEEKGHKTAGVLRMEALATVTRNNRVYLSAIGLSIFLMYYIYQQANSTSYSFAIQATSSFAEHAVGLASMQIATGIIGSVSRPFLAKFSDIFGRPWIAVVSLIGFVMGYIMILKSPNVETYIVGNVFVSIGSSGLDLLATILCADLVPLKYRGLAQGILSCPYIFIPWYSSYIYSNLVDQWRWGYGMYAIIIPVVFVPAIALLFFLDRKARKAGIIHLNKAGQVVKDDAPMPMGRRLLVAWAELDGFGLILLGFGWSLFLLPFSLASGAKGGYNNPSLIAMFVVGIACLITYALYEWRFAKFPSAPKRLLVNKTFMNAIVIDWVYMVAGYMQSLYLSSYVYIVSDLDEVHYNYYNNILSVTLCGGGLIAGLIMRFTHRYKLMQLIGITMKIIAYGICLDGKGGTRSIAQLIVSQCLVGIGGSFSVVASQVASQASVPHQDVALAISLLSLWSSVGVGIGSAISGAVWTGRMPARLRHYMPASVNDTQVLEFYSAITAIRAYPFESEIRQAAINAYSDVMYPLWAGAVGVSILALIAAAFQTNYYLDDRQNAYDNQDTTGKTLDHEREDQIKATGWKKVLRFWDL